MTVEEFTVRQCISEAFGKPRLIAAFERKCMKMPGGNWEEYFRGVFSEI